MLRSISELNKHMNNVHRSGRDGDMETEVFNENRCIHCTASFQAITDIKQHLETAHAIFSDHAVHFMKGHEVITISQS